MAQVTSSRPGTDPPKVNWLYDPKVRGAFFQILTLVIVVGLVIGVVHNTAVNLERRNIAQGWSFLGSTAGFDIAMSLIEYSRNESYGKAILVGLWNTVLVAAIGIVLATTLGFLAGVARLSTNWVIARIATVYIEVVRNIPLLLQIFFWYFGVLQVLPNPRDSYQPFPGWVFLNNRGLIIPEFHLSHESELGMIWGLVIAVVGGFVLRRWARARQIRTGQPFPAGLASLAAIVVLPLIGLIVTGFGLTLTQPAKSTFNVSGGIRVIPEFMALVIALSVYTATFIAEIVRAGILAVSHGQTEAARSLGLQPGTTLRLVVIPQAMRVIIPPLTSQYLNLTKNSSLAVAIGFPDLVSTGGTVLNQTGQAIEVIAIWMLVYLGTSLITSAFMNWYNRRVAIVER